MSVGLPVRNGARFLSETLSSLLEQTFGDFEVVISDNASDDDTQDVCQEFVRADPRIRYVRHSTNIGANANYNSVFRACTGELFRWAAHDDLCTPEYLERTVGLLDEHPDAVLAHSATVLIDEGGRPLRSADGHYLLPDGQRCDAPEPIGSARQLTHPSPAVRFRDVLLRSSWCFEIFGLMRRQALLSTGLQRNYYGTDKVLLAQMALRGTLRHVEEPLWQRRCHNGTSTYLSLWQKVRWADPGTRIPVPPVARLVAGYTRAPLEVPLPAGERWAAWQAVLEKASQPDKLQKLLLPGPSNYWGFQGLTSTSRARRAAAGDSAHPEPTP